MDAQTTEVSWLFEGEPLSFTAKLMTPLGYFFKGATRKMMAADIEDLKNYVESRA